MALPHIGSKEAKLLYIETRDFTLTIKGRPVHPVAQELGVVPENLSEHYIASHHVDGETLSAYCYDPLADEQLAPYLPLQPVFACFYEQTPYEIVIERESEKTLSFFHVHQELRQAVQPVGKRQTLTGILNFRNDIGQTTFEIRVDGRTTLRVTVEVFPAKLQYQEDYRQLLIEVNREVYNLAFDFLRRTYLKAKLNNRKQASLSEFHSIISLIFDRLMSAFQRIKTSPHQLIVTEHRVVSAERVRRTDHASRRWLERNPHKLRPHSRGIKIRGAMYLPERMLDARKRISYDSYENRVLKWMLGKVQSKLGAFRQLYLQNSRPDAEALKVIMRMERAVRDMLDAEFLRQCGDVTRVDGQSLVLQMAPGYREIYRYYLMLMKGLSIQGGIFELSVKDVAVLYEYWCFLALGAILKKKYHLIRQDAIKVRGDGLSVTLKRGLAASLTFVNEQREEEYVLSYNCSLGGSPTVGQQPDNILALRKAGSEVDYRYVFDAKYRIDPAFKHSFYHKAYRKPGPLEEDINTMHRYRDALVYRQDDGTFKRGTFGAVILFPYADEKKYGGIIDDKPHHFFKSIERVGIGGLPFLPGHTELVEDLLDDLILASPETAYEQGGESKGTEQYYEEKFAKRNVLIGVVGSSEHLTYHLNTRAYHIPFENLPKGFAHIEFVSLYEPERVNVDGFKGIRTVGQVRDIKVVDRSYIEIPSSRAKGNAKYVLFMVKEWQKIGPITPAGYGVRSRIYTTPYLLKRARYLPELSLKSDVEIRLWKELQRLGKEINVRLQSKNIIETSVVEGFEIGGHRIHTMGDMLLLDGKLIATVKDLLAKPMYVLNLIRQEGL